MKTARTATERSDQSRMIVVAGRGQDGFPERPGSVAIVPYGTGIGEIALQRGLFMAVRRRWPEADVAVAAADRVRPLIPPGIRLEKRIDGFRPDLTAPWMSRALKMPSTLESWATHRFGNGTAAALARRFDLVVDLSAATARVVDFGREWLPGGTSEAPHLIDRLAEAMRREGFAVPSDPVERVPVPAESAAWAARLVQRVPPGARVLVHPFSGSKLKLPPDETWREAIRELCRLGANPLFSSGESARDEERAIAIAADTEAVVLPRVPVMHLVALSLQCESSLMADTGLLHLVAMSGGRWTGLFGSTNPSLVGPYDQGNGRVMVAMPPGGRACETCWKRAASGSGYCPVFPGGSCLSLLDGRTIARRTLGAPVSSPPGDLVSSLETADPLVAATRSSSG